MQSIRFINASAAGPAESRINLLHGTPLRRCDVAETRDWPRQSPIEARFFTRPRRPKARSSFNHRA
jgi:hypothetical protein